MVILLTEWPEFTEIDLVKLAAAMEGRKIIDTRGLINAEARAAVGLDLWQVGKG